MMLESWFWTAEQTCTALAPAMMNWSAVWAESQPPVARIGKPGNARAMAETSRRAIGLMALPLTPPYVVRCSLPTLGQAVPSGVKCIKPDTVLVAVTPVAPPSCAARAMWTISVTFGVSLAKTGMPSLASATHPQMVRTMLGSWPHAMPMPFSPMPWGQERFNSNPSAPAAAARAASSFQSASLNEAMMEAMSGWSGKSRFNSLMDWIQYSWVFSEISSMFKKLCWFGPKFQSPPVDPRTIRGETLVTISLSTPYVFVTLKPHPFS
mmetsp:Transcript_27773/g.41074  ORF Transcript_27773/g.41074 Transcript_27773/m.41074 type:complete len:266 (+) Transcript_27773:711-1508(+)